MSFDPWVVATILAMSLVTYATRAGGYVLFRLFRPGETVRRLLSYVPGALFVSYVVPALAQGRLPDWAGAAVAFAAMAATRNLGLAVLGGTAAAWAVWAWL